MQNRIVISIGGNKRLTIKKVSFLRNHWAGYDGSIWVVLFDGDGNLDRYYRQITRPNHRTGRPQFDAYIDGKHLTPMVQTCVCDAWHGPRPKPHPTEGQYQVSHKFGKDRANNSAGNLAWETKVQNMRRRWKQEVASGTYVKLPDGTHRRQKETWLRQGFKYKG